MGSVTPLIATFLGNTLFGFGYLFMKTAMISCGGNTAKVLSFRFLSCFLVMTVILILRLKRVSYHGKQVILLVFCGLLNPLISQVLETNAAAELPTSQLSMLNSILPLVMIAVAVLINKEYPSRRQVLFCTLTVIGLIISEMGEFGGFGITRYGLFLVIAHLLIIAIHRVLIRRLTNDFSSFEIIYLTAFMGMVVFNTISIATHFYTQETEKYLSILSNPQFTGSVLYLGIGSACAGFLLTTYAAGHLPFAVYSATSTICNVVGILAGVLILHEPFTIWQISGMTIILAGVIGISFSYDRNAVNGNRYVKREKHYSKC